MMDYKKEYEEELERNALLAEQTTILHEARPAYAVAKGFLGMPLQFQNERHGAAEIYGSIA